MRLPFRAVSASRSTRTKVRAAKADERGASRLDYGLLVAGIAILVVVAILAFGNDIAKLFD